MPNKKMSPETAKLRWGKPPKAYRDTLHKATRDDMEQLVRVCVKAIIEDVETIEVAFPYVMKLPKGFPRGKVISQEGLVNVRTANAKKLLVWLKARGYTTITQETIRVQKIVFTLLENRLGTNKEV